MGINAETVFGIGVDGGANSYIRRVIRATVGTSPTQVLTITVPNGNHSAVVKLLILGANVAGGTSVAYARSGAQNYHVAITRVSGSVAIAGTATIGNAAETTSVASPSMSVGAVSGAAGATNTFPINVFLQTNLPDAPLGAEILVAYEVLNMNASGVTVA